MAHMANAIATLLLFLAICAGFAQVSVLLSGSEPRVRRPRASDELIASLVLMILQLRLC